MTWNKKLFHGRADDVTLCPVVQWAHLLNRIWTYPCATVDTLVCTIWRHGWLEQISSQHTIAALHAACTSVGLEAQSSVWAIRHQHPFALVGSGNGDVSCRHSGLHHHAHWQMVKWRIFALYPKAGQAVLARCCKENADASIVSNDPRRHTLHSVKQRSLAEQPSWQCQDEAKYWSQRISTGAASSLISFQSINQRCGGNN